MTQKPYKCRVEYLESTGTQYIDTGYEMADGKTMTFNGNIMWTQSNGTANFFYGYRSVNSAEYRGDMRAFFVYGQSGGGSAGRLAIRYGVNTDNSTSIISQNQKYNIYFDGTNLKIDGTTFINLSEAYTPAVYKSMWLFNCNCTGYYSADVAKFSGRIYNWQIFEDGVLVRDFIPVLDNSGRPAMYDQVSGQLFYNQGTGEFTYGRQIIPVEYLESTGTQYIDTGVNANSNPKYEINFGIAYTNPSSQTNQYTGADYGGTYGVVSGNFQWSSVPVVANKRYEIRFVNENGTRNGYVDGVAYAGSNYQSNGYRVLLFAAGQDVTGASHSTPFSCKLYYFKVFLGGVLVRDFIPCIDENLVPFMFDKVNNTVYLNAGTGQFKVGPYKADNLNKKILRKKLALMLANLRKKRPYYCEVEYLEADGTQYINTGLLSTANSKVDCVFGFSSMESGAANNVGVFGGRNGTTTNTFTLFKIASATPQYFRFDYNGQPSVATDNQMAWNTTSKYRLEYMGVQIIATNLTTGESVTTTREPGSTFTTYPIYLFAVNTSGTIGQYLNGRIYKFWYTDGTNTIDLIPVLDWNGVACMYDKISGQLFYNQGSGSFTAGREIHPVDYLEGTGTQYVDTGVIFNESVSYSWEIYGQCLNTSNTDYTWLIGTQTPWAMAGIYPDQSEYTFYPVGTYYQNGQVVSNTSGEKYSPVKHVLTQTGNSSNTLSLTLFARHNNNDGKSMSGTKRVFSCKILKAGNSIRDYIPAIDNNGVGYMFDQVSHTIYDNAGTGSFKYPAREVEYIETDGTSYINTGYTPSGSTETEITTMLKDQTYSRFMFGCRAAQNNNTYACLANNQNRIGYRVGDSTYLYSSGYNELNVKHTYKIANGVFYRDDVVVDTTCQGATTSPNSPLALLTINTNNVLDTGQSFVGNLYSSTIKNDNILVRDFIPVFQDGQAGVLDKVNNVFYPSVGSNTFTAGKIVEPEYE